VPKTDAFIYNCISGRCTTVKTKTMKQAAKTKNQPSPAPKKNSEKEVTEYMKLMLPPGLKFDDIYMDARKWRRN
jgi:hypothetical protein